MTTQTVTRQHLAAALVAVLCLAGCRQGEGGKPQQARQDQPKTAPGAPNYPTKQVGDRLCYLAFDNTNTGAVGNGGAQPTFRLQKRPNLHGCILCQVETYHWNGGTGAKPGTISVSITDPTGANPATQGTKVGATTSSAGQGGAPNVNWSQDFNGPSIPDGMDITVQDSNGATWSQNGQSGGAGFAKIWCEVEQ